MHNLLHRLETSLEQRKAKGTFRQLTQSSSASVDFSSNDYLALSKSDSLQKDLVARLKDTSARLYGPASSRLLDGNSEEHEQLEQQLAQFFRGQSGLLFNSGFDANVAIFSTLMGDHDVILYDELIHASTHDGMRQSRCARKGPFRHNSVWDLERQIHAILIEQSLQADLLRSGKADIFIAVEALYSMDGDFAPLLEIVRMIDRVETKFSIKDSMHIIIDEAHSTGIYGDQGRGFTAAHQLEDRMCIRLHTFGKAMSCSGAVVLAHPTIRSHLINYGRPLIYSTSMSRLSVLAVHASLQYLQQGKADQARQHLHDLSRYLLDRLQLLLKPLSKHIISLPKALAADCKFVSPIIPVLVQNPKPLAAFINQRGYLVRAICYPTVPAHEERIRVCLHAANTRSDVDGLIGALQAWLEKEEPIILAKL